MDEELSLHSNMPMLWQPKSSSLLISCSDYIIGGRVLHLSLDAGCHYSQVKEQLLKQTENQPGGRKFCFLIALRLPFIYNLFLFCANST